MKLRVSLRDDDLVSAYFDFSRLASVDGVRNIPETMSVATVVEIGEFVSLQKWLGLPLSDPIVIDCETGRIWIQAQKHEGEGPFLVFLNSGPDAFDQCVTEMRRVGAIGERRRDISAEECRFLVSNLRAVDPAIFGFEAHRSFWAETLEYLRG